MRKSRILGFALLTSLSISTLTACGGKSVENLAATCEELRVKMKPLETIELLDRKLYYDDESVATLLGVDTRASNKRFIYQTFPFMKNYTIEGIQGGEYEQGFESYQIQTAIHLFASTPNPIILTDKERASIEASENPYEEVIEPKVLRVIGESYSDDGCVDLDRVNEVDYSIRVDDLYTDAQDAAEESVSHLLGILLCERDGKIQDEKCDLEDFKSTYTASTEPSAPTDEELQILAERRQSADREAQNPSGSSSNSSVSPLQLCSSAGAVVQTENYGELTCKFVWLNRVRALACMRS